MNGLGWIRKVLGLESIRAPGGRITSVSIDSRTLRPGALFVALPGSRADGHRFVADALRRGARAALVRKGWRSPPGVPAGSLVRVDDPLTALGELALARRRALSLARVVAVTGSVGKTTTKGFIRDLLSLRYRVEASRRSFNNRIGLPLAILAAPERTEVLVLEVGANAPGEIDALARIAMPEIAVITAIGEAHLEGFGSLGGVVRAKGELLDHLPRDGRAFIHRSVTGLRSLLNRAPCPAVLFGSSRSSRIQRENGGQSFLAGGRRLRLGVPGRHNVENTLGAIAVARHLGVSWDEIRAGMKRIKLPDLRLGVSAVAGVTIIDDSYNANPCSMETAIREAESLPSGRRVAVIGDMLELGDSSERLHRALGRRLCRARFSLVVTVGREARLIQEELRGKAVKGSHFRDAERAAAYLVPRLAAGDLVLIKGSRMVGLERAASAVRDALKGRVREGGR